MWQFATLLDFCRPFLKHEDEPMTEALGRALGVPADCAFAEYDQRRKAGTLPTLKH